VASVCSRSVCIGAGGPRCVGRTQPACDESTRRQYPNTGLALTLDVTKPEDRAAAVKQARGSFWRGIDVLVNNAGIDFLGAIEEQEESDYRALFEVNFLRSSGTPPLRTARDAFAPQRNHH